MSNEAATLLPAPAAPAAPRALPAAFRRITSLQRLNVMGVGLSLASATTAVLGATFTSGTLGAISGASTLLFGVIWAALMRDPKTVGRSKIRRGWLWSILLAALNAGVAAMFAFGHPVAALLGMSFGAIVWVPAWLLTLLCFGLPIARGQSLAQRGLAGEEEGEIVVGAAVVLIGVIAMLLGARYAPRMHQTIHLAATTAFGLAGALAGGAAVIASHRRKVRRRRFVAAVESGAMPGFRVDPVPEGKVLVRVVDRGEGYRVADLEEELFDLDSQGEAMQPKRLSAL